MNLFSKKLLFVVNVDWFFLSHRLPVALAAKDAGFEVWVAATDTGDGKKIREQGMHFVSLPFSRKGMNLFSELRVLLRFYNLYRKIDPDLVHHVTIKPVLFGSLVARLRPKMKVVNAITGLGFTFLQDKKFSLLGWLVRKTYKVALGNPRQQTIFQNSNDRQTFIQNNLVREDQSVLIKGSGVDCSVFKPSPKVWKEKRVLLASRMIKDKGIFEFVKAAKMVKSNYPETRFILAGMSDDGNPNAIPVRRLRQWTEEGLVEWLGHRDDMPELILQASVVVLPTTYPEGVPKILIEAAACGIPIVASDRPGCREIVDQHVNGILIEPSDIRELANSIIMFLENPELAEKYGRAGREKVIREFSNEIVVSKTMDLYRQLLNSD